MELHSILPIELWSCIIQQPVTNLNQFERWIKWRGVCKTLQVLSDSELIPKHDMKVNLLLITSNLQENYERMFSKFKDFIKFSDKLSENSKFMSKCSYEYLKIFLENINTPLELIKILEELSLNDELNRYFEFMNCCQKIVPMSQIFNEDQEIVYICFLTDYETNKSTRSLLKGVHMKKDIGKKSTYSLLMKIGWMLRMIYLNNVWKYISKGTSNKLIDDLKKITEIDSYKTYCRICDNFSKVEKKVSDQVKILDKGLDLNEYISALFDLVDYTFEELFNYIQCNIFDHLVTAYLCDIGYMDKLTAYKNVIDIMKKNKLDKSIIEACSEKLDELSVIMSEIEGAYWNGIINNLITDEIAACYNVIKKYIIKEKEKRIIYSSEEETSSGSDEIEISDESDEETSSEF